MRGITHVIVAAVVCLWSLSACGDKASDGGGGLAQEFADHEAIGPASGLDAPGAEPRVSAAAPRRLSIDQLEGSIPVLTGRDDLTWRFLYDGATYDGFKALGVTLGRPDYYQLTDENREPSALYIKLMGDMSADVCEKIIVADLERTELEERTFLRHVELGEADEALIAENLRYLLLFYLGEYVTDDAGTEALGAVYEIAHNEAADAGFGPDKASRDAWQAVCMALLASPQFHIY